ncbi:MAG: hypothetical protein ACK52J_03285 [bacterium]
MSIGRLVFIKRGDIEWGWGVSLNFNKKKAVFKNKNKKFENNDLYIVDVMIHIQPRKKNEEPKPIMISEPGEMEVIPMNLDCIYEISSVRIMLPDDLTNFGNKLLVKETLIEVILLKRLANSFKIIFLY